MSETDETERIALLAEQVKLLFAFCYMMVPDIDLLERVAKQSAERESFAYSAAPLISAFGMDYEDAAFDAELHRKRADALLTLVKVLRDTETDRAKFEGSKKKKAEGAAQLRNILGMT